MDKNPNETLKDKKRLVEKPDTTKPKGYTINEVIEAYCGAELPGEITEEVLAEIGKTDIEEPNLAEIGLDIWPDITTEIL